MFIGAGFQKGFCTYQPSKWASKPSPGTSRGNDSVLWDTGSHSHKERERERCFNLPFHPSWHPCGLMPRHHFCPCSWQKIALRFFPFCENLASWMRTFSATSCSPPPLPRRPTSSLQTRFLPVYVGFIENSELGAKGLAPFPRAQRLGHAAVFGWARGVGQSLLQAGGPTPSMAPALTCRCPPPA